jgi:hypothetical protein
MLKKTTHLEDMDFLYISDTTYDSIRAWPWVKLRVICRSFIGLISRNVAHQGHRISTFRSNVSSPSSRFETYKNDILALEDECVIGLSSDVASYPGRTKIQVYRRDNHMRNSQTAHVKKICRMSFRDHILSNGNFAILTTPCVLCVTLFDSTVLKCTTLESPLIA